MDKWTMARRIFLYNTYKKWSPSSKLKKDRENNLYIKQKHISVEATIHYNQIRITIQSRDLSAKCVPREICLSVKSNKARGLYLVDRLGC